MTPCPKPTPKPKAAPKRLKRSPWKRERPTDGRWSSLKSSAAPQRKTRIKARGKKGHKFPKLVDQAYRAWIRTLGCRIAVRCEGPVECAHVRSRGAGGADRENCVPLCRRHHAEQHAIGIKSFQKRYHVCLMSEAHFLDEMFDAVTSWPVDQERVA